MFKSGFRLSLVVFVCLCFIFLFNVFAQQPPSTLVSAQQQQDLLPPQDEGSQGQPAQQTGASTEEKKQQEPQVLVVGSSAVAGQAKEVKNQVSDETQGTKQAIPSVLAPENVMEKSETGVSKEPQGQEPAQAQSTETAPVKTLSQAQAVSEIKKVVVNEPEDSVAQWVWGEVVSTDIAKKQITVKYLDYETYDEALMILDTDGATVFNNVSGFSGIKPSDYVTIDYKKQADSNLATLVEIEKKDASAGDKEAVQLKEEKMAAISSGGVAAAKEQLDKEAVKTEVKTIKEQESLNQVQEQGQLDSLDDITVPLAPNSESVPQGDNSSSGWDQDGSNQ